MPAMVTLSQDAYRFRNDDGSETTATWKAAVNIVPPLQLGVPFRIRFLISRLSEAGTFGNTMTFRYSHNGGTFKLTSESDAPITTSPSVNYTQGDDSTQQLGADTYISNNNSMAQKAAFLNVRGDSFDWTGGLCTTEMEYETCVQLIPGHVSNGDTIELRCYFGSTTEVGTMVEVPILTIVKAGLRLSGSTMVVSG